MDKFHPIPGLDVQEFLPGRPDFPLILGDGQYDPSNATSEQIRNACELRDLLQVISLAKHELNQFEESIYERHRALTQKLFSASEAYETRRAEIANKTGS